MPLLLKPNKDTSPFEPIGRVDDSVEKGILRTAEERNANLIDMLGLSSWGVVPNSIARISQIHSRIVIYFPSQNVV